MTRLVCIIWRKSKIEQMEKHSGHGGGGGGLEGITGEKSDCGQIPEKIPLHQKYLANTKNGPRHQLSEL